jgi:sterol desaturase/sphingolipid hydroxylase (fatty acid hydroxylase superfamily)
MMFHAVPLFWRLHMVHHSDMDFDVTTGVRFHPIEIILSMGIKMVVVILIGPPPLAVPIFEILLNGTSMFNHGNVRYSTGVDSVLRLLVVTPEMHRVHHSTIRWETNCNFGFNFPWWDRLFGTYRPQPAKGHLEMTIGLDQYKEPRKLTLPWLLALPLIGKLGKYPMTRSPGVE